MDTQQKLVLLVEDDPIAQKVASILFKQAGQVYDLAIDTSEALEMLTKKDYTLILSDLRLPGMDTREFMKLVRQQMIPGQQLVGLSSNRRDYYLKLKLDEVMDGFFEKPLTGRLLTEIIDKHLNVKA